MNPARSRAAALLMAVLLALYLAAAAGLAVGYLGSANPIGISMGIALMVLPILGAWALVREVRFGLATERLIRRLAEQGDLVDWPDLAGVARREAAKERFAALRDRVMAEPDSWPALLNLALCYDAAGDRPRARNAARRAILLARAG